MGEETGANTMTLLKRIKNNVADMLANKAIRGDEPPKKIWLHRNDYYALTVDELVDLVDTFKRPVTYFGRTAECQRHAAIQQRVAEVKAAVAQLKSEGMTA